MSDIDIVLNTQIPNTTLENIPDLTLNVNIEHEKLTNSSTRKKADDKYEKADDSYTASLHRNLTMQNGGFFAMHDSNRVTNHSHNNTSFAPNYHNVADPDSTKITMVDGLTTFNKSVLSFRDLTYVIPPYRKHCWSWRKTQPKVILQDISGIFPSGVNAIMGPSGSGKTSLLTVLGGRKFIQGVDGLILVDGKVPGKNFATETGFITQEDVIMGTLTVRKNIMFSAALRLPTKITKERKARMVQDIIDELNLGKCADSKVGNQLIRGISGGERKRCNVGVELITHPSILFLDEPTTGLDAATAFTLVTLLKKLSDKGCNIIMSIHQPRYDIFTLFDNIILLSTGQIVYQGSVPNSLEYFSSIGFECEVHNNPADYYLDIIERSDTSNPEDHSFVPIKTTVSNDIDGKNVLTLKTQKPIKCNFAARYRESESFRVVQKRLDEIEMSMTGHKKVSFLEKHLRFQPDPHRFATGFSHQLKVLSQRIFKNFYRNPHPMFVQCLTIFVYSMIVGAIYFNVSNNATFGIQNRRGAIFFMVMNQVFGNMSIIELFIAEKLYYIHETTNGFYRVSVFFLSKSFCDLVPMRIIPVLIVSFTAYWMIGLKPEIGPFLLFILTMVCLTTAASAVSFFASCLFDRVDVACDYCGIFLVFQMVLGGLFVNIESIAYGLRWTKYISIFRYACNALMINEIKDKTFCDTIPLGKDIPARCVTGNAYLAEQGIPYATPWDFWFNHVALLATAALFWLASYLQLRRIKTHAQ